MKTITTFISASNMKKVYTDAVVEFANKTTDYEIVFGGDPNGLMGTLGHAVVNANGNLTGVTTQVIIDSEGIFPGLHKEIRTETFDERKRTMIELSDYIVCFPGGSGTFEEIFQAISWGQCGFHESPYMFLNINGFYDLIEAHYALQLEEGVIGEDYLSRIAFPKSVDELLLLLKKED